MTQLISREDFTNVQEAQAGITRLFKSGSTGSKFFRVMRNKKPLGVLIPENLWRSLIEDFEALSSPYYLKAVEASRKDKKRLSSNDIKRRLGIK